jgi:hypothetical protein
LETHALLATPTVAGSLALLFASGRDTARCVRQGPSDDDRLRRGIAWLLDTSGIENRWGYRMAHLVSPSIVELDPSFKAWPWRPGSSSWIEPTAHALVALKKVSKAPLNIAVQNRIAMGEKMILERRCSDGGWNYGNRKILGTELPSYPETTALALLGLSGKPALNLSAPLAVALRQWKETRSPLARAWLAVSSAVTCRCRRGSRPFSSPDTMLAALRLSLLREGWHEAAQFLQAGIAGIGAAHWDAAANPAAC